MRGLGGVKAPHRKNTADRQSEYLPVPAEVIIPMSMHIGLPAKAVVAEGDAVRVGQLIGQAQGSVSSPVHSSVSGTVKCVEEMISAGGAKTSAVRIMSNGKQEPYDGIAPPKISGREEFLSAVRESGVVGLGGAGFPTAVKLAGSKPDYIIVNGAECEPYITSDTRAMLEDAEYIWKGVGLLQKFIQAENIVIAIEDDKPGAVKGLREHSAGTGGVTVKALPSKYPQGGEKVLIYTVTGRIVPEGKLPGDVGTLVINCATLAHIAKYMETGMPLVSRRVTVDGSAVREPKNVIAPIGAPVSALIEFCGGFAREPKKLILGGPMMGVAIPDANMPVTKTTNAVLAFDAFDAAIPAESACIRCGRCVSVCPMGLMPVDIETAYRLKRPERLEKSRVKLCMECGCCAYSCPAKRPLTQVMRLSKRMLSDHQKARGE